MDYFTNELNKKLAYNLLIPKLTPAPVVIFSHGFDSSKSSFRSVPIANELLEEDIASLLFDYTGHGDSEGLRQESTFMRQSLDLKSALNFLTLRPEIDIGSIGLNGSSSGCLPILCEASQNNEIGALVLRAPRTDEGEVIFRAHEISAPTLIIQGENDPLLPQTRTFYKTLENEKELIVINGADHLFTNPAHFMQVLDLTIDWFVDKLRLKAT